MITNIGVIGCGAIGRDHIRRITEVLTNAKVTACSDVYVDGGQKVAEQYGIDFYENGEDLIASEKVDAVVICSNDASHAKFVLACIYAGKPVLCEKPLGTSAEECKQIIDAEMNYGKRLVQVGFMRRYDKGYAKLKEMISSGIFGAPLMIHACHRNKSHILNHTSDMTIKNAGIHEIDVLRWLIDEDYKSGGVLTVRQNSLAAKDLLDPQIMQLESESGIRIDVEINMSSGYGYDIQCEVVCEKGTIRLPDPNTILCRHEGQSSYELCDDWSKRFIEAYDIEFKDWILSIQEGVPNGPTSWDGYVACVVADTLITSRNEQCTKQFQIDTIPLFYV